MNTVNKTTEVIHLDQPGGQSDAIRAAAEALARGELVGFPTETVYGVAARADLPKSVVRLRELKSREADKAFTVHVAAREDIREFVTPVPGLAERLVRKSWPGPLTLIVDVENPSAAPIASTYDESVVNVLYHEKTVGLRCPDDPVASGIIKSAGGPVVATSANLAGKTPPVTGQQVLRDFQGRIDLLIDAGRTRYAKPSTIVRITKGRYEVVREGVLDSGVVARMATLRLLFVCTGNTCRSVMASALAKKMIADRLGCGIAELPSRDIIVQSAGISGGSGGAHDHAIMVMRRKGLDVTDHSSTLLSRDMIHQADYVFAMTEAHREQILEMAPAAQDRVECLIDGEDVRDPIRGGVDDYERCARVLDEGLRTRLEEITL